MKIGISGAAGSWVWDFPGTEEELLSEWANRFAPLYLDPAWTGARKEPLGEVMAVESLPDGLDGQLELGRRPMLTVGTVRVAAGRRPKRRVEEDPVFGPLATKAYMCITEVEAGRLVSLRMNRSVPAKVVKATLAHPCIRSLRSLALPRIDRLSAEAMARALAAGGALPTLTTLEWLEDLDGETWGILAPVLPALSSLTVQGRLAAPPPPVERVAAVAVGHGADHGPRRLELVDLDLAAVSGWWRHVEVLSLLSTQLGPGLCARLQRAPAPPRLRELVLAGGDARRSAEGLRALFATWPALQLVRLGEVAVDAVTAAELVPRERVWSVRAVRAGLARKAAQDPDCVTYSGRAHGYALAPPLDAEALRALEARIGTRLPEDYRLFLTAVGASGAGPFNGILDPRAPGVVGGAIGDPARPFDPAVVGSRPIDGVLALCDHGSGLLSVLVVNGAEAGTMWFDARADDADLQPHIAPDGTPRLSFADWYLDWLEEPSVGRASR